MSERPLAMLFLCTHNSARSILAEGIATRLCAGRWIGYSAGSRPSGRVNPFALDVLRSLGCDTAGMQSKHWSAFTARSAPTMDFVITVCDNAAGEVCPVWPGAPTQLHWGLADPSTAGSDGDSRRLAFQATARLITERLDAFMSEQSRTGAVNC